MATQYVNVLEQYKLFFVNRPFTFPGDKTVNKKQRYTVLIMIFRDIS
ncbi:hypothetical protein SAMN05421639_102208 [Chryseobacterium shigense]|uniref:Uncharacterized protein n=1 Tax=Chryseobacterium shigense TaxID=297244 RepID=A0A1N7I5S4_9FLAO|nr:hypothetical protein SAMN05421639_102208 [Chryseobacterium shigense]